MQHPLYHGSLLLEEPITVQLSLMDRPTADGDDASKGQQRAPLDHNLSDIFRGGPAGDRFYLPNM